MRQSIILLITVVMLHCAVLAQPGVGGAIYEAITNGAIGVYGAGIRILHVVNVDTAVGRHDIASGLIENERGTLTHAYVFSGKLNIDAGFVGIYRNNQIIWISDTVMNTGDAVSLRILGTRDMLRDGSVEIVVVGGMRGGGDLWIFRWDGQSGALISAVDDFSYSSIEFSGDFVRFADVEGDGILELQAFNSSDTLVTYGWNGQQYGKWSTTPQPLKTDYLPMDRFIASVSTRVVSLQGTFRYYYRVQNDSTSLQSIQEVIVKHHVHPDSITNQSGPTYWWAYGAHSPYPSWINVTSPSYPRYIDVMPGKGDSSFAFSSFGLPAIIPYYLLGRNVPSTNEDDSLWEGNILNNSVSGRTVGPTTPLTPFNGLTFLDSLKSYITQSRALGWVTSDPTANKYKRLVDTARSYLQSNIRGVTKAKLDSILFNVHADSASTLTSEAYALIRFNTEYVLKKLREEDSTYAADNKSSSADATMSNSARHLVKAGGYLHEVFASGGDIFYRQSADEGETWGQTYRINTAIGDNSRPCIAITQHPSIEIVWQRRIAPSTYEVWSSYSEDNGASWPAPAILPDAGEVEVSGYQTEGPMPVITEGRYLVAVYCSKEGLRYRVSEDDGSVWQVPATDIITSEYNDKVRFPSLAGTESYASLLYDIIGNDASPYSRIFNGSSWSNEETVGKDLGGNDNAFSSVAIDANNNPIAVWSGITNTWTRSVIFRAGYADNTWSNWFAEFGQGSIGPDWLYPSVTYYKRDGGQDAIAIVNHTSSNFVYLNQYVDDVLVQVPYWDSSVLSESGIWASISQENASSGKPFHCLTDQSAFPYEVVTESSSELSMRGVGKVTNLSSVTHRRRAVVYHPGLRSTLTVEFEPLKIVNANGDTSIVRFKSSPKLLSRERDSVAFSNMWEYLGSGVISVPANARRLILTKQFVTGGPSITKRSFSFRLLNSNGIALGVLDTTTTSGSVAVDISRYAGTNVVLRPQVTLPGINPSSVVISVGDVFTLPAEPSKQLQPNKKQR